MFFAKELKHTINLHPKYFGPQTDVYLRDKLHADVEGTCSGRLGYIIAVLGILEVGKGTIQPGTGMAEFIVKYRAIVYKPFRDETVDGTVKIVNKMGFYVEVGPLTVFVSSHHIPPDMHFDSNANPPCFTNAEEQLSIERNSRVRLKILGTRIDATEIFAIGTIRQDYLGLIQA